MVNNKVENFHNMKHISITAFVLFFCVVSAISQSKVDNTINSANAVLSQADKAGDLLKRAKGWLPKKKEKKEDSKEDKKEDSKSVKDVKKATDSTATAFNTTIKITGITFMKLKALQKNALDCECVTGSDMAFNAETSSLKVAHKGKTEDLLKLLLDKSKDIFTENQIQSFEEGKIEIKL